MRILRNLYISAVSSDGSKRGIGGHLFQKKGGADGEERSISYCSRSPEQPPPEPVPGDVDGDDDAPNHDHDTFIDGGIDDEDIKEGVEERNNEESMKQQGFSCFSTSIVISFKQNRHLSELEEYRSGANSNDVAKDGAEMYTNRRHLYQRVLTRPLMVRKSRCLCRPEQA